MRSRLKLVGHVKRMEGGRLPKRADALRVESRRGRPRLMWEECVKIFVGSGRGVENESEG